MSMPSTFPLFNFDFADSNVPAEVDLRPCRGAVEIRKVRLSVQNFILTLRTSTEKYFSGRALLKASAMGRCASTKLPAPDNPLGWLLYSELDTIHLHA